MTVFRTNGERFLGAAARFFFLGVWLPSAYLLGDLPLWELGIRHSDDGVLAVILALMAWGVATSFLAVAGIATEGNAWFRARQRPVLTWLARPAIRWTVLAAIALLAGAFLASTTTSTEMQLRTLPLAGIVALLYLRSVRETAKRDAALAPRIEMYAVDAFAHRAPYIYVALMMLTVPLLGMFPRTSSVEAALTFGAMFALSAWRAQAPIAEVGKDGLYIRSLRPRFVPFRRGDAVLVHDWGCEIRRGETLLARLRYRAADIDRKDEIATRIRTVVEAIAHAPAGVDEEPHTAYRSSATTRDVLWRIVDTPELSPRVRIDAAVKLQHEAEEGDDERLESVAESTADPKIRAILRNALVAQKDK